MGKSELVQDLELSPHVLDGLEPFHPLCGQRIVVRICENFCFSEKPSTKAVSDGRTKGITHLKG